MTEPSPQPDSWRQLDAWNGWWEDAELLANRRIALLAAEEHLPTFHVRPVLITKHHRLEGERIAIAAEVGIKGRTEWRWVAVARNGEKLFGSTESYEHRQHAIDQAHSVADPMGAQVVIDDGGE